MLQITTEDKWHEYAKGARIKIRPLRRKDVRAFLEKAKGDDSAYDRLVADHVLQDWKGFSGPDGSTLPVTPENKLLVMDVPDISRWVDQRASAPVRVEAAEEKN